LCGAIARREECWVAGQVRGGGERQLWGRLSRSRLGLDPRPSAWVRWGHLAAEWKEPKRCRLLDPESGMASPGALTLLPSWEKVPRRDG